MRCSKDVDLAITFVMNGLEEGDVVVNQTRIARDHEEDSMNGLLSSLSSLGGKLTLGGPPEGRDVLTLDIPDGANGALEECCRVGRCC